ncbi:MAG: response regulator [Proteobacteria bacterium]|nr:response regulator [Pseudomonadota bacterium]MBU1232193.1 response regulator [Pseudomonadota bacterium]MBU1417120.1 response regulator [Pseudomonadota bacterium]MBU1453816.1 response regulator [Pseudomonadota bacterium]
MTISWLPVIWTDILGSIAVLVLSGLCAIYSLRLLKKGSDQTFYHYLFLLTLSFLFFAVSRSFGHLVKQTLLFYNQDHLWLLIAPFSGAINTAAFIVVFSFGIYCNRSRIIHNELEQHKTHLSALVAEQTRELTATNLRLSQEIADRILTEKELEKAVYEFSAVMDAIDYGVLFMDDQLHSRIVNRAFLELWGLPHDFEARRPSLRELLEYNRYNNIYKVSDEEFEQYMDEREAQIRQGTIAPMILERKDGKILQYQCVVLPDGWRMLTYFDITELKKTQEKLAQSQKMEAIGMMAGGVAHDLNNILSGIVSYPDLLLMKLSENSKMRKPLEVIKESGQRASQVVADLLTVARGVAGSREICSLNTLIIEHLKSPEGMKMLSLYPEVQIKTALAPDLLNISCSSIHCKKCLMNLLLNSAEAIDGPGIIHIETKNQYLETPVAENQYMKTGEYAVVRITDNGKGIEAEDISHIFEPFYTKKILGRSGTGLGLAIVWNTVQEHNGTITVNSSEQGTSFEIYFPIIREELSNKAGAVDLAQLQGHDELLLIVDDERQQRDITAQMLSILGYRVETVASGEEALAFVRKQAVDLIVLDMIMAPGINGRQTYEQIIAYRPGQKAIIASGYSENEEVVKAQALGAGIFLRKPYTIEQIGIAVKNSLT